MFGEIEQLREELLVSAMYISIATLEQFNMVVGFRELLYLFRDKRTATASRRRSEIDISRKCLAAEC